MLSDTKLTCFERMAILKHRGGGGGGGGGVHQQTITIEKLSECIARQQGRSVFIQKLSQAVIVSGRAAPDPCWIKVMAAASLQGGADEGKSCWRSRQNHDRGYGFPLGDMMEGFPTAHRPLFLLPTEF